MMDGCGGDSGGGSCGGSCCYIGGDEEHKTC